MDLQRWEKSMQNFDMDIINRRLACHGELVVLPKHYGTLNSEYVIEEKLCDIMKPCKSFADVRFMHFSALPLEKPWSHSLDSIKTKYEISAQEFVQSWFEIADEVCPGLVHNGHNH